MSVKIGKFPLMTVYTLYCMKGKLICGRSTNLQQSFLSKLNAEYLGVINTWRSHTI